MERALREKNRITIVGRHMQSSHGINNLSYQLSAQNFEIMLPPNFKITHKTKFVEMIYSSRKMQFLKVKLLCWNHCLISIILCHILIKCSTYYFVAFELYILFCTCNLLWLIVQ